MEVVASVAAVVGLVFNFATAIKTCNDLRSRYKDASRTIESIRHELETLQGALQELANIMMHDASALTSRWDTNKALPSTFARAIAGFNRTIKSLKDDMELLRHSPAQLGKMDKVKLLWNEDSMKEHLGQLRAQSSALQLLLLVLQTAALSDVKSNLNNVEAALVQLSISSNGISGESLPEYQDDQQDESGYISGEGGLALGTCSSVAGPSMTENLRATMSASSAASSNPIIPPPPTLSRQVETSILSGDNLVPGKPPKDIGSPPTQLPFSSPAAGIGTRGNGKNPETVLPSGKKASRSNLVTSPNDNENENVASPGLTGESTQLEAALDGEPVPSKGGTTKKKTKSKRKGKEPPPADQASFYRLPALINAVTNGNLIEVKALLDSGANLEDRHPVNDRTSINIAASLGYSEILEALLGKLSGSVSAKDRERRTALHYAASEGHIACVNLLLTHNASTSIKDFALEIPLHRAIRYGRVEVVKALLAQDSNPLRFHARLKRNSLHIAAVHRRAEIVKLLCEKIRKYEHGEDCASSKKKVPTCNCPVTYPGIDEDDNLGNTALQNAIKSGDAETVSAFIKYSTCDVNAPYQLNFLSNKELLTATSITWRRPLHFASSQKNAHLLPVLLAGGADVNLLDSDGLPPIERAMRKKNKEALVEFLKHGARFDFPSKTEGVSLLHQAVENFTSSVLDDLVSIQPNIDLSTPSGETLLRVAQVNNKWEIIETLIQNCSQGDAVGKILDDASTLQHALKNGSLTVVRLLLEKGADANRKFEGDGKSWNMPLHETANCGNIEMANELVSYGAKILMKDSDHWWPIHYAIQNLDLDQISWFLLATKVGLKEARSSSSGSKASKHDHQLNHCLILACRTGQLKKLELIFELDKLRSTLAFSEVLHAAVKYGRVDMTRFLLESGYDPLAVNDKKLRATEIPFRPVTARDAQLGNNSEDYEKCREIVQQAIDKDHAETARAAAAARDLVEELSSTSESEDELRRSSGRWRPRKTRFGSSLSKDSGKRGHRRRSGRTVD